MKALITIIFSSVILVSCSSNAVQLRSELETVQADNQQLKQRTDELESLVARLERELNDFETNLEECKNSLNGIPPKMSYRLLDE